ncbi:hypothetical protein CfE428DRAFT_3658 [Chthoniobacter flavus Ellin428]|uniref:PKD domain-containing protein n=1 Tax=Chthoniobacter flavus Ellin428 TaxID=497964 RepID=B4D420_9BACT|nr:hypothetical protein [Chthoniobacter flavus]EDY19000.1 hypothetical protein CfE428DRAFT_3658 [Chthoniobacter flavus Ellin428]TCO93581.1 hypothetical protein EV701_104285 [Chthoniobacter flavus]
MKLSGPCLYLVLSATAVAGQLRINQEGRVLGPAPVVTAPILFDTPQADAVVAAMQIMPVTSAWNEDVSRLPLLSNSDAMITQITNDLASNRRTLRAFFEMNYVLVPDNQPTQSINFFNYPDESDLDGGVSPNGLYPIPANLPIETWPVGTGTLTLQQWQQDDDGSDRHAIMVAPGAGFIWETWETLSVNNAWQASNGAKFDLKSNTLRPAGWTSGDAAGLPMFPALVRYDECQRGMVEHAVRLVVKRSRQSSIYPATHQAGSTTLANVPAMGQRLRLKASFVIPSTWTKESKAVALALKKYGGIVADNGGFLSFSVCPDDRFAAGAFDNLSTIAISNFEVVQSTGATGGPRSPGAPTATAGADQTINFGATVTLAGNITATGSPTVQWKMVSGPGTVTFGNAAQPATTATFSLPGAYILMLNADDGVHAVARDAVTMNVLLPSAGFRSGNNFVVQFPTLSGRTYRVEESADMSATSWTTTVDNIAGSGAVQQIPVTGALANPQRFYRVRVLP